MQAEGQHVERMLVEDLLPGCQRGVDVAVDPMRQRCDVRLLAACRARRQPARCSRASRAEGTLARLKDSMEK